MPYTHLLCRYLVICSTLGQVFAMSASNVSSGALVPLTSSHCDVMAKLLKSIIYPTDYCVFLVLDYIDCPLHIHEGHVMVTLSLEKLFSGFVSRAQDKFYCDKAITLLHSWGTFRPFMVGRGMAKIFDPYTRMAFFSETNSTEHGVIFDEAHLRQIYLGALHVYYGRIITATEFELEDVLTRDVISFETMSQLQSVVKITRNLLLHSLFNVSSGRANEVNVSLYHCDPFVLKLDDKKNMDR